MNHEKEHQHSSHDENNIPQDDMTFGQEETQNASESEDNLTDQPASAEDAFEALQQKYGELNDSYLRLHAEFDNYRKRTIKEKADIIKSGGERVLTEIISLVDDFERALSSIHTANDKEAILQGIDLIYGKFGSFLTQHGVKEIEAIGQDFDPEKFEAVTTVPVQDAAQSGKIIDCIQKGYSLNDKIIRFPKVIVGE